MNTPNPYGDWEKVPPPPPLGAAPINVGANGPRRGRAGRVVLALVVLAVVCFGGIAVGAFFAQPEATSSATSADAPAESDAAPGSASVGASAKAAAPTVDDGVWTVGVDVPAGKYKATEPVDSLCYWEISKTDGAGGIGDIVSNDLPGGGRPQVTLKKGQTFKSSSCGTWRKV